MRQGQTVIVDGYNVIHQSSRLRPLLDRNLESARNGLIVQCSAWLSGKRHVRELVIVFDGDSAAAPYSSPPVSHVKVLYSRTGEKADDRILSLLKACPEAGECVIVSEDNDITQPAKQLGACVLSAREFLESPPRHQKQGQVSDDAKTGLSPADVKSLNDDLRREWGIR